jgi:phosphoglycerol transferase MdoB-like AlkP superfamily enzyme
MKLMKWIKNIIIYTIIATLIIISIINLVTSIKEKEYDKLLSFVASIIGCFLFSAIDSYYQKKVKTRVKETIILYGLCIISIYIMPFIASFVLSIFSSNFYVSNIFKGFLFPLVYFAITRFRNWLEENEPETLQ